MKKHIFACAVLAAAVTGAAVMGAASQPVSTDVKSDVRAAGAAAPTTPGEVEQNRASANTSGANTSGANTSGTITSTTDTRGRNTGGTAASEADKTAANTAGAKTAGAKTADDKWPPRWPAPLTVRIGAFTNVQGGHSGSRDYTGRFRTALGSYLKRKGRDVIWKDLRGGQADCVITAQMAHVEGPDTPFLTQVLLFTEEKGRPGILLGHWCGSAASIYHFDGRLNDRSIHPQGLAGDIGDRVISVLQTWRTERAMAGVLQRQSPGSLKVNILAMTGGPAGEAHEQAHPAQQGGKISAESLQKLRLQVEMPEARAVMVLGREQSGRWVRLFVPEREEGAFSDGTVTVPLNLSNTSASREPIGIWVVVAMRDAFARSKEQAHPASAAPRSTTIGDVVVKETGTGSDETGSDERVQPAVQVMSGTPQMEGSAGWNDAAALEEIAHDNGEGRFRVLHFEFQQVKPAEGIVKPSDEQDNSSEAGVRPAFELAPRPGVFVKRSVVKSSSRR